MVDITITATSVIPGSDAVIDRGSFAGAMITAGQVVYKEAATGLIKLADCDSATAEVKIPYGIALNGGATGQPIAVQTAGSITVGGTLVAGTAYYLSDTAGGIRTTPDTGDRVVQLGLATSTTVLALRIQDTGVTL
jgi:hypothetical protein